MTNKKQKAVVVATATVLSISATLSNGASVFAQKSNHEIGETTLQEKPKAPATAIPEAMEGIEGQALQEIALPKGWSWQDGNILLSSDKSDYVATYIVDDETYDYTTVEGYDADSHSIETTLTVIVQENESLVEITGANQKVMPVEAISYVNIDASNFPDNEFRKYIKNKFDLDKNDVLDIAERSKVELISISMQLEIKSLKGIEHFTNLRELYCNNTGISSLDIKNNSNLELLDCSNTEIKALDVGQNFKLKNLFCSDTDIPALDISTNTNLLKLNCSNTDIIALDVSGNKVLEMLNCSSTNITELNISGNLNLQNLLCDNTNMGSLDISKNTLLALSSTNNALAFLNIGMQPDLNVNKSEPQTIYLDNNETTFNIKALFKGIDVERITNLHGGTLDKSTGVMSGYLPGIPITYSYDCGISKNGKETLDVTIIQSKLNASIEINKILNKTYDRIRVSLTDEDIVSDSTGAKSYIWEQRVQNSWVTLSEAPVHVGAYRVMVKVAGTDNYFEQIETQEFTIEKADTIISLNQPHKRYNGQPVEINSNDINVIGSKGNYSIRWLAADGTALNEAPVHAGAYKIQIGVEADANYHAATETISFTIEKADTTIRLNKNLNKTYDDTFVELSDSDLSIIGSTGVMNYQWAMEKRGQWVSCGVPKDAGNYRLQIDVAEDENHTAATAIFSFTINSPNSKGGGIPEDQTRPEQPVFIADTTVKTGDEQMTGTLGMLSVLSLGIIGWLGIRKRKQEMSEE